MTCSDLTSTLHRWVCYLSALATLPAQKCSLMVVESLGSSPAGSGLTGALLAQCSALHPASAIMGCSVKASSCPPPTGSWASQGLVVLRGRLSHRHRVLRTPCSSCLTQETVGGLGEAVLLGSPSPGQQSWGDALRTSMTPQTEGILT